jgi:hypothetical protein
MEECLALLATKKVVVVAQHEAHGGEEVALARAIATDNDIAVGREGLYLHLVLVALEALDGDLLDVPHAGDWARLRRANWYRMFSSFRKSSGGVVTYASSKS